MSGFYLEVLLTPIRHVHDKIIYSQQPLIHPQPFYMSYLCEFFRIIFSINFWNYFILHCYELTTLDQVDSELLKGGRLKMLLVVFDAGDDRVVFLRRPARTTSSSRLSTLGACGGHLVTWTECTESKSMTVRTRSHHLGRSTGNFLIVMPVILDKMFLALVIYINSIDIYNEGQADVHVLIYVEVDVRGVYIDQSLTSENSKLLSNVEVKEKSGYFILYTTYYMLAISFCFNYFDKIIKLLYEFIPVKIINNSFVTPRAPPLAPEGDSSPTGEGDDGAGLAKGEEEDQGVIGKPTTPASQATCACFGSGGRQQWSVEPDTDGNDGGGRTRAQEFKTRGSCTVNQPGAAPPKRGLVRHDRIPDQSPKARRDRKRCRFGRVSAAGDRSLLP
ncbi:hypothetical protein AGLY_001116 [Aphis glycines]|uniref:Uncharacterized protein n=1 Tax=Aphis glycines TaxID=307491 RepID=A0A6G0U9E8_APHGL|nr:hypothetical protein AGLY_001116 [Aphis glycines]